METAALYAETDIDFAAELERVGRELQEARRTIALLSTKDGGRTVLELGDRCARLEGRLQQETTERSTAERKVRSMAARLREIAEAAGTKDYDEIPNIIRDLRR